MLAQVRLQGYSEDPMKEEIIRGQTETIKLLQAQVGDTYNPCPTRTQKDIINNVQIQLRNLQKDHSNTVDQRARDAENALRREQIKVGFSSKFEYTFLIQMAVRLSSKKN